jgi:hypothetical protein
MRLAMYIKNRLIDSVRMDWPNNNIASCRQVLELRNRSIIEKESQDPVFMIEDVPSRMNSGLLTPPPQKISKR